MKLVWNERISTKISSRPLRESTFCGTINLYADEEPPDSSDEETSEDEGRSVLTKTRKIRLYANVELFVGIEAYFP